MGSSPGPDASRALSRRAQSELLAAVSWIAKDNRAAAQALRDAVVRAADRIGSANTPGSASFGLTWRLMAADNVRFVYLTGFPYVIVYNSERVPPLILRFLHGARDLPEVLRGL